jgi:proton-translocating NADH-quinone oxidoreductase chain L
MLLLVSAGNLLVLFLGWEGVGLCSYLLISFWYTRAQAVKAATKAFLVNKVGDLFLLSAIAVAVAVFYSTDFGVINSLVGFAPTQIIEIVCALLFIGAVGKSAQIGLHTWLPDAMEGPTPVSALIHAATMVTAGIFLVIRCSVIFENAPVVSFFVAILGGITALFSGTIGIAQNDIKKIIAYSTCSQLGYMAFSAGISLYDISLFHLFNHAFFKALLFLSAGSIIHLMSNEQDIRKMGGLASLSPFVYIAILIASLALAGFPFLAGFYSKDVIIEAGYTKIWFNNAVFYWLIISSAILTAMYSLRLLEQVFWEDFNGFKSTISAHVKVTNVEIIVLGVLGTLSIFSGYWFKDMFASFGPSFFNNSVALRSLWGLLEIEGLSFIIKILPLLLLIVSFDLKLWLFECKWFYNEFVNFQVVLPTIKYGRHTFEQVEKSTLENLGPLFFYNGARKLLFKNGQQSL